MKDIHITHIRHLAGELEEGMQLCRLCGEVLLDYTDGGWCSPDGSLSQGFPSGFLYVSGKNPTSFTSIEPKPEEIVDEELPWGDEKVKYINRIIGCDNM